MRYFSCDRAATMIAGFLPILSSTLGLLARILSFEKRHDRVDRAFFKSSYVGGFKEVS